MTVFEVMVVVVCVLVLAVLLLPILARPRRHVSGINCVSNLRQVNIALRIREGDNGNQYPMAVSVTNGGAMELIDAGDVIECFRDTSNEMATTKILVCPNDSTRTFATNYSDLNGSHISYFLSADASNEANPNIVLDGDDNIVRGGSWIKRGLLEIPSNSPVSWFGSRHYRFCGNIGFADGSVDQTTSNGLQRAFQGTGLATNRIVIP